MTTTENASGMTVATLVDTIMLMATKDQEEHKDKEILDAFLNLKFNSTRIKIRFEIQDNVSAVVAVAIVYLSSTCE